MRRRHDAMRRDAGAPSSDFNKNVKFYFQIHRHHRRAHRSCSLSPSSSSSFVWGPVSFFHRPLLFPRFSASLPRGVPRSTVCSLHVTECVLLISLAENRSQQRREFQPTGVLFSRRDRYVQSKSLQYVAAATRNEMAQLGHIRVRCPNTPRVSRDVIRRVRSPDRTSKDVRDGGGKGTGGYVGDTVV